MRLLLLLLLPCSAFTQKQIINDTNVYRYSYFLMGYKSSKTVLSGSGFIVSYKDRDYLVTNYHVITDKHPFTKEQIRPTPDSIGIAFRISLKQAVIEKFPLFINDTVPLYQIKFNGTCDVAILPISIPEKYKSETFKILESNFDTLTTSVKGQDVVFAGYPKNCSAITGGVWPCIFKSNVDSCFNNFDKIGLFCFNTNAEEGASGSPVYMVDPVAKTLSVIGVLSIGFLPPDKLSGAVYMWYVKSLLDRYN